MAKNFKNKDFAPILASNSIGAKDGVLTQWGLLSGPEKLTWYNASTWKGDNPKKDDTDGFKMFTWYYCTQMNGFTEAFSSTVQHTSWHFTAGTGFNFAQRTTIDWDLD